MNSPFTDTSLSSRLNLGAIGVWNREIARARDDYAPRSVDEGLTVPCGCGRLFRSEQSVAVHRGRVGCKGVPA